jgi:hypothetical protein
MSNKRKIINRSHVIEFKTSKEFYVKELMGDKPNTVRILSKKDTRLMACPGQTIRIFFKKNKSIVKNKSFERELTDISIVGELLGKYVVVYSWR